MIAVIIYLSFFIFSIALSVFLFLAVFFLIRSFLAKYLGTAKTHEVESFHYKNGTKKRIIEINPNEDE